MPTQEVIELQRAVLDAHSVGLKAAVSGDADVLLASTDRFIESVRALAEAVSS